MTNISPTYSPTLSSWADTNIEGIRAQRLSRCVSRYISTLLPHRLVSIAILLCCALAASAQAPAPMTVKAKSDSTTLIMGDRTTVNVEVIKNGHPGVMLTMPEKGKDYYGLEITDIAADSADLGNGRIQLNYRLTCQAFDPADLLTLPPFVYAAQGDTVKSSILTFKVLPVELSPELGDINNIDSLTIHPSATVVAIPAKWYDFIPNSAIWILIILAVAALGVVLAMLYRKNGPALIVKHHKPTPPYELAIMGLNKIRKKQLIEKGLAKQFFTEATDVWRKYLEGRFGINAMEMTSKNILKQLRHNQETHLTAQEMEQVLALADFVKFAALNPTRDEMIRTYDSIYSFVESTKPVVVTEDDSQDPKPKTEN